MIARDLGIRFRNGLAHKLRIPLCTSFHIAPQIGPRIRSNIEALETTAVQKRRVKSTSQRWAGGGGRLFFRGHAKRENTVSAALSITQAESCHHCGVALQAAAPSHANASRGETAARDRREMQRKNDRQSSV